jgi:hypothetical protein
VGRYAGPPELQKSLTDSSAYKSNSHIRAADTQRTYKIVFALVDLAFHASGLNVYNVKYYNLFQT